MKTFPEKFTKAVSAAPECTALSSTKGVSAAFRASSANENYFRYTSLHEKCRNADNDTCFFTEILTINIASSHAY